MELLTFKAIKNKEYPTVYTVGYTDEKHIRITEFSTGEFTCRVATPTENWKDKTPQMVCKDLATATIVANAMLDLVKAN